jgi:hypothetical protein
MPFSNEQRVLGLVGRYSVHPSANSQTCIKYPCCNSKAGKNIRRWNLTLVPSNLPGPKRAMDLQHILNDSNSLGHHFSP